MSADHCDGMPDEVLDSTWRDVDLARLSQNIVSWEELAPFWGLTEAEEMEIKKDNPVYAAQKLAALRRWKAKCSETATYRQLVRVFARMGKMELVEKVREIVLNPEEVPTTGPGDVLSNYREFLEMSYNQLPQPGILFNQWPVMSTYCTLPLSRQPIKRSMLCSLHTSYSSPLLPWIVESTLQHGNDGEELEQEVHLPQLLTSTGGRLVIKGLPGSGKTTLMWHTSQQWAKRELFQQFSLFLSIPLRSTRVQHATCLADFIPHPDQEQKKAIAQAISASNGEDVCFWFDGWDEMPQEVQSESFVASFIRRDSPGSSLPKCTTVVTTRPEALYLSIKSSEEIWMNGLTVNKVHEIITKSVEDTDHDPSKLITSLENNTSLQAFCLTVPINVVLLISLFYLFQSGLPNTQTELFKCLVLNLLLHNLQLRWKLGITSLKSFTALPELPAESFISICEIAFNGIMNTKTVFLKSDIPSHQKQDCLSLSTFGLMEIIPQIDRCGIEEELTFLHTTLQEFLAAVHLTTLDSEKQISFIKNVVESRSWYQKSVLEFYVGLVGLNNHEVFNVILEGSCDALHPLRLHLPELCLLTFVNCVFEAQSGHLCQEVAKNQHFIQKFRSFEFDIRLAFHWIGFNTTDLSHLGYFIGWFCQTNTCELTLYDCYITPQQFKVFVNQVKQVWNNELHRPSLSLHHFDSPLSKPPAKFRSEQLHSICQLIKDTSLVSRFNITLSFYADSPARTHYYDSMKNIIEAFARNSTCRCLILNHFSKSLYLASKSNARMVKLYSDYYAALLLTFCRHVKFVAFYDFFQLDYAYPLFSWSLQYNTSIVYIDLSRNSMMCEKAISNIARALANNKTVEMVDFGNWISTRKLETFLNHYALQQPVRSGLRSVRVGCIAFPEGVQMIIKIINCMQLVSGQPMPKHPFHVVKYVEADPDGDDGYIPAHNVFYTGFDIQCRVVGLADSEEGDSEKQSSEEEAMDEEAGEEGGSEVEFSKMADSKHND